MTRRRPLAIIPAFNESETIFDTITSLVEQVDVDVVVIDDGSRDATADIARQAGAHVLELPFNLGIGGALRTGFIYAVRNGYAAAFQFDADGQHDPKEVRRLLEPLSAGSDMVIGSRFLGVEPTYRVGSFRRLAMRSLRWLIRQILGQDFSDTSSGFRAFNREVLEHFSVEYPDEYMESVEALMIATKAGFSIVEIPVQMSARAGGTPSARSLRSVYHLVRIYLVLVVSAPRSRASRTKSKVEK
jgi:glycosyltransferase involved in cell wall biosynthesis